MYFCVLYLIIQVINNVKVIFYKFVDFDYNFNF